MRAGLSALAAGLLLKLVGANSVTVQRVYGADGQAIIIGQGNTGSSTTTLSSPVNNGSAFFADNAGGTGDAQAFQGRITGSSGRAFVGFAQGTSGSTIALDGVNNSPGGIALRGANTATTGNAIGVQGQTESSAGAAIIAKGPGGVEVLRALGNGNVGIGASSPAVTLHLSKGGAGSSTDIQLDNTDTGGVSWAVSSVGNLAGRAGNFEIRRASYPLSFIPFQITPTLNVGIGTTNQFGGGSGVIGIANAVTVPASSPSAGGILFVDGGALKYRGPSTTTTIAPA